MKKIKEWLNSANGWQRLWFVCSLLFILYSAVIWPLNKGGVMSYRDYFVIESLEKNPECHVYFNKSFSQLVKPSYDHTCYDVYSAREIYGDSIPGEFTSEKYLDRLREIHNKHIMEGRLIGLVGSMVITILVYGAGWVFAWIIKGFKK